MAIDATTPNSPGWWFKGLLQELGRRQVRYNRLDRYFVGNPDLPRGAENAKETYRQFQRKSRTNFAGLIVEAVRERMVPQAFRTGADGSTGGDKQAWDIWQANCLDADSALVHRASLAMGDAYVIVGSPDDTLDGAPLITPEDPRQVITAHDPLHRRRVVAALKVFTDSVAKKDFAYLFTPGEVFKASRPRSSNSTIFQYNMNGWVPDGDPQIMPFEMIPVVRFSNRSDLMGNGLGEFEDVMDVLDRINHMLLQRLVIATMQAFKQRAIKGADALPTNDIEGNAIDYNDIFSADPGALWKLPTGADLWESSEVNLDGILHAVRDDIQDLAAVTRTPLFYLTPDAANGSAEGASLAREGLVFKATDRIAQASESWEQVMTLALQFAGADSAPSDMEVVWRQVDLPSLSERADAAVKAVSAGVPWRTVMQDIWGYSPQQIDRMEKEQAADKDIVEEPAPLVPVVVDPSAVPVVPPGGVLPPVSVAAS